LKKITILIATITLLISCSSDGDSSNSQLPLTLANISGNWNVKQLIKPDGTKIDYINLCATQKDYIKFYTYFKMEFYYHGNDCIPSIQESCTNYYFLENNLISNCNNFVNGAVSSLTATEMQIDYGTTINFPYGYNNMASAKGIILVRE
jgi:hypothetical protein